MRFLISIKSYTYECLINLLVGLLRHHRRSPGLICIISQFYCVTSLGTISSEPSPSLALARSLTPTPFGMNIESHMFSFHVHSTTSLWRFLQSVMKVLHAIQRNKKGAGNASKGSVMIFPHHIISCFVYLSYNSCVLHISIQLIALHQITMASNIGANNTQAKSKLDVGAIRKE